MTEKTYSIEIAAAVESFLKGDDWHYSFDDRKGIFHFGLSVRGMLRSIRYAVDVKEDEYVVYAYSPIGPDTDNKKMMQEMAEFICRANYGMQNGNFEFDFRDGEIRFKSYVDCEDGTLGTEVIRNSIYVPAAMFDRYGDGIIDIIFKGTSAKETVRKCEEEMVGKILSSIAESDDSTDDEDEDEDDEDLDAMLARLAARLGIDPEESVEAEDADPHDPETETDSSGQEGGAA